MRSLFKNLFAAISLGVLCSFSPVHAQDAIGGTIPDNGVLSDGVLTKEELARYMVIAKAQLEYLTKHAAEEYAAELKGDTAPMPRAWMLMKDGESIKEVKLDQSGDGAPPEVRAVLFRAAMKSIARGGEISAATILFAGQMSAENPQKLLVFEYEHRVGVSSSKFVPYSAKNQSIYYGKPVIREKPFQLFYDTQFDAPGQ